MPVTAAGLRDSLEKIYSTLNRREFVQPDPLQFLYDFSDIRDREIAGLIASSLAFGNVRQIIRSVSVVLKIAGPSPRAFLEKSDPRRIEELFRGFKHRFVTGIEISGMLLAVKLAVRKYGSLENCFMRGLKSHDRDIIPALETFVSHLSPENKIKYLLPSPSRGSACKRLNLYLRWMVRHDEVDPGGWNEVPASKLLIPLDTHMWKICRRLKFTERKQPDLKAVVEITENFRKICPEDPVRYDFSLTRSGIKKDLPENLKLTVI
jgi:uncharacterized protein (TIGR02757 family)